MRDILAWGVWGTLVLVALKVLGVKIAWIKTLVPNCALFIITSAAVALLTVLVGIFDIYEEYKTQKEMGEWAR